MGSRRVAIDASRATRPDATGTEIYARRLIEALVTPRPESDWILYFRDDPGDWLADLPHVRREVLPLPRLWTYGALAPALARERPDLFWEPAHVLPPTAPLLGIPSLVTVHDLGYEHFPAAHPLGERLYLRATTRYHCRAATHLVVDSAATRQDLIDRYGAAPERLSVVHLGVDHDRFRPVTEPEALRAVRQAFGTGPRYLLTVGTLQPRKNIGRLLAAFAMVAREIPDVTLVLAGAPGYRSAPLEQEIARLGLEGRVVRPGFVPAARLPALLSAAEALLFPSLFEGFGLPVLEAMACGTPVLTARGSSLPEVAGDAALLVNPLSTDEIAMGMRLLLSQPRLRAELRRRGLARSATFTWERAAVGIERALERISPPPAPARIPILSLPVDNLSWTQTIERIAAMIAAGRPHQIATLNPEFLMAARRDPRFMDVLRGADLLLPDGVGLLLAARWQGQRFADRVTGSDLTPRLAAEAAQRGWRLYLLGAGPGVAERAAARLRERYPGVDLVTDGSDPAPDGPPELIARIRAASPDILLVAYGAPKQDLWIARFGPATRVPVQIGVGGALDFLAGLVPRAPVHWQRLGLEWLWRLKEEPWRWRRMLSLPRFALAAAREAAHLRFQSHPRPEE